ARRDRVTHNQQVQTVAVRLLVGPIRLQGDLTERLADHLAGVRRLTLHHGDGPQPRRSPDSARDSGTDRDPAQPARVRDPIRLHAACVPALCERLPNVARPPMTDPRIWL